jgi:hypothetical protein
MNAAVGCNRPEETKQVSPGQSEAAQPPSAALGYQTHPKSVALKGQIRLAARLRLNLAIRRISFGKLFFGGPLEKGSL